MSIRDNSIRSDMARAKRYNDNGEIVLSAIISENGDTWEYDLSDESWLGTEDFHDHIMRCADNNIDFAIKFSTDPIKPEE